MEAKLANMKLETPTSPTQNSSSTSPSQNDLKKNGLHDTNTRGKGRAVQIRAAMNNIPLEEAARLEIQSVVPSKTPVSILQELLSRRGTTPKYELVQVEGAIHEPTFRYRVTVADVVEMGTGKSKKEAKHSAAKAVLDRLVGNKKDIGPIPSYSPVKSADTGDNPIGLLQELCMQRRWPPPAYETEKEEGLPHEREFTIACLVHKYKEVGAGKSKKLAKRQAANQMWKRLKDLPVDKLLLGDGQTENTQRPSKVVDAAVEFGHLKSAKIPPLSSDYSAKVTKFHKNLKKNLGEKMTDLQNVVVQTLDCVKYLNDIATEQHFEVLYIKIDEKSISGKCQFLVQLSTEPVALCHGVGLTYDEAKNVAAQNTLDYLKLMTK